MTAEHTRIQLSLEDDPRLLPAVSSAVGQVACGAGFASEAIAGLIGASDCACRETFPLLRGTRPHLDVTVERFSDRIEVTLTHQGEPGPAPCRDAPGAGSEGKGPAADGVALLQRVDRVLCDTAEGMHRTKFVKYLSSNPPARS